MWMNRLMPRKGVKEIAKIKLTLLLSSASWRASMSAGLITVICASGVQRDKKPTNYTKKHNKDSLQLVVNMQITFIK